MALLNRRELLHLLPAAALAAPLPKSCTFWEGSSNTLVFTRNKKNLVVYGDPSDRIQAADMVLLTDARRDISWSAHKLVQRGATPVIPQDEASHFTNPQQAWQTLYTTTRLHDYANQGTHFPTLAFSNPKPVKEGDTLRWQDLTIEVISTPGYTRGAVSYLWTVEGQRILATGNLILPGGKIADLYSLQDAIPDLKVRGYHGFASRISQLMASLRRIAQLQPDKLIPARGPIIENPQQAITQLLHALSAVYANYMKTDAYRWYFGEANYHARAQRILGNTPPTGLPFAETIQKTLPSWMRAVSNSRLILSKSGEAILIDCGSQRIIDQVRAWKSEGLFSKLRAIYITHYHDDHTDFAQAAADQFGAELWSSTEQQDILKNPSHYRMPCLTSNPIPGLKPWRDLESRDWHEFQLQNFHFPGQTIYHGALLVKPKTPGQPTVFFIGDSFTPSGVDDYCLLNRNLLAPNMGLIYCLGILESIPHAMLVNQHVEPLFRFSAPQLQQLKSSLNDRIPLLAQLFPWDNPNFGIDEQWFRLSPYVQQVAPGALIPLEPVVLNHSARPQDFHIQIHPPPGWTAPKPITLRLQPHQQKVQRIALPPTQSVGLHTFTASIQFQNYDLRHWTESLLSVASQ